MRCYPMTIEARCLCLLAHLVWPKCEVTGMQFQNPPQFCGLKNVLYHDAIEYGYYVFSTRVLISPFDSFIECIGLDKQIFLA